jgi:hypothetical protein
MQDPKPAGRKMRTYTLTALLAVFVGAATLAVVNRILPGRLSRLMRAPLRRWTSRNSAARRGR